MATPTQYLTPADGASVGEREREERNEVVGREDKDTVSPSRPITAVSLYIIHV